MALKVLPTVCHFETLNRHVQLEAIYIFDKLIVCIAKAKEEQTNQVKNINRSNILDWIKLQTLTSMKLSECD